MKKIYLVVALLAIVLMSTTAIAQKADKELCLTTQSSNPSVTTQSTHILSYSDLIAGHVIFYGETCYIIPAAAPIPEVRDCLPVIGSGILNEGKLEFGLHGVEYNTEEGFGIFTAGEFHVLLSIDTLTGTYASESINYFQVEGQPLQQEVFDNGTVKAVKCSAVTKSEIDADKQFKKLIDQLDKLGNVE